MEEAIRVLLQLQCLRSSAGLVPPGLPDPARSLFVCFGPFQFNDPK